MKIKHYIYILLFGFISFSCKNKKDVVKPIVKTNEKELTEVLFSYDTIEYNHFYSKINVDFKDNKSSQSFKTSLKMSIDSAFSGTITYASIVFGTFMVNQDSLYFTDKQKKCYMMENLTYISSLLSFEFEYKYMQALLLGKPVGLDHEIKYKQIKDKNTDYYILASHNKRKFEKIEKDKINLEKEDDDNIYIQYFFSTDSLELKKMHIDVPTDSVSIDINYVESEWDKGYRVPTLTTIKITHPNNKIIIQLEFLKPKVNEIKEISINIPDSYNECGN